MGDFEKGKRLIIEGWELVRKHGAKLLGRPELFAETYDSKDNAISCERTSLIRLGIDTFLSSLRNANNVAELEQAIEDNKKFWEMVFPKS